MKEVINIGIGGKSFVVETSAYEILKDYLNLFASRTKPGESSEIMEDIEARIAELLSEQVNSYKNVVTEAMVSKIVSQLGLPNGETYIPFSGAGSSSGRAYSEGVCQAKAPRKLYRDSDDKMIGGVCSGLAYYLNADAVLIRVIFLVALIFGLLSFWVYLILWIVAPIAENPVQKCEMRGWAPTAENLGKFYNRTK